MRPSTLLAVVTAISLAGSAVTNTAGPDDRAVSVAHLESPIGWTYRVGVNLSRSWYQRLIAERRARTRIGPADHHLDEDVTLRVTAWAALQRLPERQREAVLLRHLLGMTGDEAAAVMGTTPGNVRVLAHRGVARLRAFLDVEDNAVLEVRDGT